MIGGTAQMWRSEQHSPLPKIASSIIATRCQAPPSFDTPGRWGGEDYSHFQRVGGGGGEGGKHYNQNWNYHQPLTLHIICTLPV